MFVQLQAVSVTMTYDSSGNLDIHVPDTLVDSICGMCNTQVPKKEGGEGGSYHLLPGEGVQYMSRTYYMDVFIL